MADNGIALVLRTHDSSRVADVVLPPDMTADQVVMSAVERWKLPTERDYTLQCGRLGQQLPPGAPLAERYSYQFYIKPDDGKLKKLIRGLPEDAQAAWEGLTKAKA